MRRVPALLLALGASLLLPIAPASAARLQPVASTLAGQASGVVKTGAAPAGQRMRIGVLLAHPHPAQEDALLKGLYDPSSSSYHQFLTPTAYARRFGVSKANRAATASWLRNAGLTIESTSGAGDYVLASGTTAQVAALADVQMDSYRKGTQSFVANAGAPKVPASLPVLALEGLSTLQRYKPLTTQANPDIGNRTPQDLWSIYDQPGSQTGKGVSVAILGSGKTDAVIDDLHKFDTENGFSQLPVDVKHTPAQGDYSDDSGDVEWNIDMQAIHGMAPGISKEVMYFSPTLADSELVASLSTWVNDPTGPPIMNASLGECEAVPVVNPILNNAALDPINGNNGGTFPVTQAVSQASEPATTMLLQQAIMEGRTFFAASGDNGSSCSVVYPGANGVANEAVPLTSDPASTPFTTAVGGTVLYSDGKTPAGRALEQAWTYSGGNSSPFITAPDYQKDVPNLNHPCVADADGQPTNTGKLCRGVPDVAALSGDVISNGYTIVSAGADSGGGGTSLSSPLWAGMWARVIGALPAGSTGYGFANEALYKIAKDPARYPSSFFDITLGTNGLNPALPGYDYVTGLGVPKVSGLLTDVPAVAPPKFPASTANSTPVAASSPTPAATTPSAATCKDKIAPVSRFTTKTSKLTRTGVTLHGTSSDAGCGTLKSVSVSIGRAVGTKCRFLHANGSFGATTSCLRTTYLSAKGTSKWSLTLKHRLPKGSYKVFVRGIDSAKNYERKNTKRNFIRLRVR